MRLVTTGDVGRGRAALAHDHDLDETKSLNTNDHVCT